MNEPSWLTIARELRALAQTGLTFAADRFDRQRYERLRELAATMLAKGSGGGYEAVLGILMDDKGYATPKVDVRGACFLDDRILLVREISDGKWTLPGGWADINQTPSHCVVREIAEESGFIAKALKLAAVYDYQTRNRPGHIDSIYKLLFICEITGGAATPSDETSEVAFFAQNELPPLSLGRINVEQIDRMYEHYRHPELATDFD
jgi:ADP-ribose pyrophosphatase YjhB (NUDIX family)